MRYLIGLMGFATLLTLSSMAYAQTSESETSSEGEATVTEEGASDATNDTASGLSMGQAEVDPNQPYIKDTYGDWQLRCVRAGEDGEICQLYQLMQDERGNSVAEFNLFPLPDGQEAVAGANIVTPLETLLTASLRLAVDGGQAKRYPYSFCSQVGCFSRIGLTAEEVASFRRGAAATVTIVPAGAPNEVVALRLSLTGFTAGFEALVESESARTSSE